MHPQVLDLCAHTNRLRTRHAAEKMLAAGGSMLLALLAPPVHGGAVIFVLMTLATLGVASVAWRHYLHAVMAPFGFLLAGAVSLCVSLSVSSQGQWHLGLAPDGGAHALQVTLRALGCVSCLLFLAFTTPIASQMLVLQRLRAPASLVELALLIYRFIFVLIATVETMINAQSARLGYATIRTSFRSLGMLAAAFFHQALARARRLEDGLAARGWQGELRVIDQDIRISAPVCMAIILGQLLLGVGLFLWK
ncbi:MAG: cobalt ECF transporter T component CbiQ [Armatimonadota bacterium]